MLLQFNVLDLVAGVDNAKELIAYHKRNGSSGNIEECNPPTDVFEILEHVKYTS